jgi:hypothetical protein
MHEQTAQPTPSRTPSKPNGDETLDTTTPNKSSQLGHPSISDHPFHKLFNQATAHVEKEDEKQGRKPDEKSERLAMSATALAAENGIRSMDQMSFSIENKERGVKAGENVIIVQGGFNDPAHELANMKTEVAINTPVEQSLKQWDVAHQQQQAQTLALQQTPDLPTQRGPSIGGTLYVHCDVVPVGLNTHYVKSCNRFFKISNPRFPAPPKDTRACKLASGFAP